MIEERIEERRKGNAEREPGAIAIQYGASMTCICISPSRPRDYSHGPVRILLSPGSRLFSGRIVRGFPSSILEKRSHLAACRQSADDADRDNNIVTLSLHAQPTHTLLSLPECKLTPSLIVSNCAIRISSIL